MGDWQDSSDDDDMLRKAELLAMRMRGLETPGTITDQPSVHTAESSAKSVDAMIRETEMLFSLLPAKEEEKDDPLSNDMLLKAESLAKEMQSSSSVYSGRFPIDSPVDQGDGASDDMMLLKADLLAKEIQSSSSVHSGLSPANLPVADEGHATSVDEMLLKAELLAKEMQSTTSNSVCSSKHSKSVVTAQMTEQNQNGSIDDLLKQAELFARQMQTPDKSVVSTDTSTLLYQSDSILGPDGTTPFGRPSRNADIDTPALIYQADKVLAQSNRFEGNVENEPPIDDVLRQTEMLVQKMKHMSGQDTDPVNHTVTTADLSMDTPGLPPPPLVTPNSADGAQTKEMFSSGNPNLQLQRTEEMVRLMSETVSSFVRDNENNNDEQPGTPPIDKALRDSAALMERAMASLKQEYSPVTKMPTSIVARSPSMDDVSSVGSGSARSLNYLEYSPMPSLVRSTGNSRFPSNHSRGDLPPLPRKTTSGESTSPLQTAEETARQMIEEASAHSKDTKKAGLPPPPPPPLPQTKSKAEEEQLYAKIVKKIEGDSPMKWEKVKSVSRDDDDYVPLVDYSKSTSKAKSVPTATNDDAHKSQHEEFGSAFLTPAQRHQRKLARRKNAIRIFVAAIIGLFMIYFMWKSSKQSGDTGATIETKIESVGAVKGDGVSDPSLNDLYEGDEMSSGGNGFDYEIDEADEDYMHNKTEEMHEPETSVVPGIEEDELDDEEGAEDSPSAHNTDEVAHNFERLEEIPEKEANDSFGRDFEPLEDPESLDDADVVDEHFDSGVPVKEEMHDFLHAPRGSDIVEQVVDSGTVHESHEVIEEAVSPPVQQEPTTVSKPKKKSGLLRSIRTFAVFGLIVIPLRLLLLLF